jgi:hypothetical protein
MLFGTTQLSLPKWLHLGWGMHPRERSFRPLVGESRREFTARLYTGETDAKKVARKKSAVKGEATVAAEKKHVRAPALKRYEFSFGNSGTGPIGFVVHVIASSRTKALALLHKCLPASNCIDLGGRLREWDAEEGVRYFEVYFNPDAMRVENIMEWSFED